MSVVLLRRSHAPQVEITPAHAQGLSFSALLAHSRCSPQGGLVGNETLAEDIYLSVKQSSGLTQGMTVTGIAAVVVATVGMCGSVRGSPKCLYCYAVSSMTIIVCQSIFIAMLNFSVEDLDATVKTMIQDSDAAKDLVRMYMSMFVGQAHLLAAAVYIHILINICIYVFICIGTPKRAAGILCRSLCICHRGAGLRRVAAGPRGAYSKYVRRGVSSGHV